MVIAASSWFDAARPVGQWIDTFLRVLIGSAVVLVPIALAAVAMVLMRTEPDPESRPRLILGSAMVALPALGLWHLWAGSPQDPAGRQHAAGFLGFAIGGPLSDGLTDWIAAPLLFIGVLFGLLLVTGTTIREVPSTVQDMFSTRCACTRRDDEYYDEYDEYDRRDADQHDDFSDGYYDDRIGGYHDDEAQAQPGGARQHDRWTTTRSTDEAPTVPEPSPRRGARPRGPRKQPRR